MEKSKFVEKTQDGALEFYLMKIDKKEDGQTLYIINKNPVNNLKLLYKRANYIAWRIKNKNRVLKVEYIGFANSQPFYKRDYVKRANIHGFRSR